jgi:acetyl esterase/lipase
MKRILLLLHVFIIVFAGNTSGQIGEEKLLYPGGIKDNPILHKKNESFVDSIVNPKSLSGKNRVISFISDPTYFLYAGNDTENKHIGVVILPGGGLVNNWIDKEGNDLAIWLSQKGISCLVLKYRTNEKNAKGDFLIPLEKYQKAVLVDAQTAITTLRSLSDKLKIEKEKVGIIGFSAGGWISEQLVYKSTEGTFDWNPGFVGLIYHGNNYDAFERIKKKDRLPPFFMAAARNDKKLPMETIIPYLSAIVAEVNKSELHIYSKGDHGFGLAYNKGLSVELWKESFYRWLLDIYEIKE